MQLINCLDNLKWESENDRQSVDKINQFFDTNTGNPFNFLQCMYYNNHQGDLFNKLSALINSPLKNNWIIQLLQLLQLRIHNTKTSSIVISRLYFVSNKPLPYFICDICENYFVDLVYTKSIEQCVKVMNLDKNIMLSQQCSLVIIDMNSIEKQLSIYDTLNEFENVTIFTLNGDNTDNIINVNFTNPIEEFDDIKYYNNIQKIFIEECIKSIEIKSTFEHSSTHNEIFSQTSMWSLNKLTESVDGIDNLTITYIGKETKVFCLHKTKIKPVSSCRPIHVKPIIQMFNSKLVGDYMFFFLNGDSSTIRIKPGVKRRDEIVFKEKIKAGSVQTIIFKCFDSLDNITSIGPLQMVLKKDNKKVWMEFEESVNGYISCTPVLYAQGKYDLIIISEDNQEVKKTSFEVESLEVCEEKTVALDEKNKVSQNILICERNEIMILQLKYFDKFDNPISKYPLCNVTSDDVECPNIASNIVMLNYQNVGTFHFTISSSDTGKNIRGFPKTVIVNEKDSVDDFTAEAPKFVCVGDLLKIVCSSKIKNINRLEVRTKIGSQQVKHMIIQTEKGFDVYVWCCIIGNGAIAMRCNDFKYAHSFKVGECDVEEFLFIE
ncbi:Uncharacterized protein QTN25_007741 [Entamoeba marina]